jgi:hypothetical protein
MKKITIVVPDEDAEELEKKYAQIWMDPFIDLWPNLFEKGFPDYETSSRYLIISEINEDITMLYTFFTRFPGVSVNSWDEDVIYFYDEYHNPTSYKRPTYQDALDFINKWNNSL